MGILTPLIVPSRLYLKSRDARSAHHVDHDTVVSHRQHSQCCEKARPFSSQECQQEQDWGAPENEPGEGLESGNTGPVARIRIAAIGEECADAPEKKSGTGEHR